MTRVAGPVYVFQGGHNVLCACKPAALLYIWHIGLLLLSLWHVDLINCVPETLHKQTNAFVFRGCNVGALSSKGSLIEHCKSIIQVNTV